MKKELAGLVFGAMLAAALCADAGTLLEIPKNVKLGDRQCKALCFPWVDPAKGRVVVDLSCRIDYPRAAGWCPCWQIEVNGKAITAAATRSETRLLNRPYCLNNKWHGRYAADNRSDKWYALYLPDFKSAGRHFNPPLISEATRVALDISDLVKTDSINTVTHRAGGVSGSFYKSQGATDRTPSVVFGEIRIYMEKELSRIPRAPEKIIRATVKNPVKTVFSVDRKPDAFNVSVSGGGTAVKSVFGVNAKGGYSMALLAQDDVFRCASIVKKVNCIN